MAEAGKRPFWMHQLVEYILGGALVASGLQSPQPLVPAVLGGIVMVHAAITRGALAAFRIIDRRLHRVIDPAVIALQIIGAVQQWISVDNGTRFIIGGIAAVHLVVWLGSSFTEKPKAAKGAKTTATTATTASSSAASAPDAPKDRATDLGRSAGRLVGGGVKAVRAARAKRSGD
jgi:hypothetical protein